MVQTFTDLPSAQGSVGNTGLAGSNHGYDVPVNELVFDEPLVSRYIKFEVSVLVGAHQCCRMNIQLVLMAYACALQVTKNHGADGTGFYRMTMTGSDTPVDTPPTCNETPPSNSTVGSKLTMQNTGSTLSIDFLNDGVLRFTDAKCLEATLCNTCGVGGGVSGDLATAVEALRTDMDEVKARLSTLETMPGLRPEA
jgi:hypothetical protein